MPCKDKNKKRIRNQKYWPQWANSHKECRAEWQHQYYLANKEKLKKRASYYALHRKPRKDRAYWNGKRQALKRGATIGPISLESIKLRDKMICGICHRKVREKELAFDHIIPLSRGGAHAEWNLQVSHRSCNAHKHVGTLPSQIRLAIIL